MLGTWYRSKDSDSVSMQELRKREYARACDLLRLIVGTSRYVNHKLVATAAEDGELLDTRDLTRHTYGGVTVERGRQPLQPGESFDLKDERTLTYHLRRVSNVYFGHYTAYLEAADIAKLLANGGKLELVPVTDAPESN